MPVICKINGCKKEAEYNIPTEVKRLYCGEHKTNIMINVKVKRCIEIGCMSYRVYNYPLETKPLYCNLHKKDNMINIKKMKCIESGCLKQPNTNFSTESKPLYCSINKKDNMINIKFKKCIETNCLKRASYNIITDTKPLYCNLHKRDNMIEVRHKRCIEDGCLLFSSYNYVNKKMPVYCNLHKKDNMINIKTIKCIEDSCLTRPNFNFSTESKALYCNLHKKDNMINVKVKRCIESCCIKCAKYNFNTEIIPIYCLEHKKENMIDIISNKCLYPKCKDIPIFGLTNKKAQYCLKHKQPNMINIVLYNKCSIIDCDEEYSQIIESNNYCNKHIPEEYVSVIKRLCKYCDIKENIDYVCRDCKKIQNKKEWGIVRYLRRAIKISFEYNSSKMLQGCSKKRPDIYFDLDKHCLIVEIDEHQHNSYEDCCECARINEIVNGIGGKSVIIIRYNPDIIKNNNKVINIENCERINLLVKTINEELVKNYDTFIVKIIQLYYNDNYDIYCPIKEDIITDKVCV